MKNKYLSFVLIVIMICIFSGCLASAGGSVLPHTAAQVEEWVQEAFFDENGAKMDIWQSKLDTYRNSNMGSGISLKGGYELQEVTGFTITKVKYANWLEPGYVYLIEFEPQGFILFPNMSDKSNPPLKSRLVPFPSPYKMLNIEEENRYCSLDSDRYYATKRDGYIVSIEEEAYYGTIYELPYEGWEPPVITYDTVSKEWIPGYVNHKRNPWTREEMTEYIWKNYFDEDKKPKLSWEWYYDKDRNRYNYKTKYDWKEIGGFEVQEIKDADSGEYNWLLIEFEPYGHILWEKNTNAAPPVVIYSSPYKILDITVEDRLAARDHEKLTNNYYARIGDEKKDIKADALEIVLGK